MKKSMLILLLGVLISVSATAQTQIEKRAKNTTIKNLEKVESVIKLTEAERESYSELRKEYNTKHFEYARDFKKSDPALFKSKIKENNKDIRQKLIKAFGKERGMEIYKAQNKRK